MGWLREQLEAFLQWAVGWVAEGIVGVITQVLETLIVPIVGTPGPTGQTGWVAFGTPANEPWGVLYQDVYLTFILPLSLGLLFVALAYVGLRSGSLSPLRRQRLTRRLLVAVAAIFLWFPLASAGTQLFDAIGIVIATGGEGTGTLVSDLGDALKVGGGGVILLLVIYAVEGVLILGAALVFAIRWLAIIVLTLAMPLLATLWAVDVWPLSGFANAAGRLAAFYPGLLLAGLPSALLLRIAVEAQFRFGFGGLFGVLIGAALVPAAAVASIATIKLSSREVRRMADTSARVGTVAASTAPSAARSLKERTGQSVRGARNVHRGFAGKGAVRSDGTTAFGGDGMQSYRAGKTIQRTTDAPKRAADTGLEKTSTYAAAARSDEDSVTELARQDASRVATRTRSRAARAARVTKQKLSRW